MDKKSTYLESKPRYEILDGLRGVAAMLVVAYHLFEIHYHGGPDQPINHGYLAVDFFFVLSGFVIGYAYDDRWRTTLNPSPEGRGGKANAVDILQKKVDSPASYAYFRDAVWSFDVLLWQLRGVPAD